MAKEKGSPTDDGGAAAEAEAKAALKRAEEREAKANAALEAAQKAELEAAEPWNRKVEALARERNVALAPVAKAETEARWEALEARQARLRAKEMAETTGRRYIQIPTDPEVTLLRGKDGVIAAWVDPKSKDIEIQVTVETRARTGARWDTDSQTVPVGHTLSIRLTRGDVVALEAARAG